MTDVMVSQFVDAHPSKGKLTSSRDCNCFLIASTVSSYSSHQMLIRVMGEGSTRSLRIAVYDRHSSRFDLEFHEILAKTNPNMR